MKIENLMTREELAKALRISIPTIMRWEKEANLPRVKVGAWKLRYDKEEIEEWLAKRKEGLFK